MSNPNGAPLKYKKAEIEQALTDSRGLVNPAARALKCAPNTILNYLKRYPDLVYTRELGHDRLVDSAEVRLIEAVEKDGFWPAVVFTLKTLGKNRGYVERNEQQMEFGKDGNSTVTFMLAPGDGNSSQNS